MTEAKRNHLRLNRPQRFRWINGGRRKWERENLGGWEVDNSDIVIHYKLCPEHEPSYMWATARAYSNSSVNAVERMCGSKKWHIENHIDWRGYA